MKVKNKPPVRETTTVEVSPGVTTRPTPHSREFDPHARTDTGSLAISRENLPTSTRTANEAELDAILPAPRVTVNEFDLPAQPPATPAPQPLEHYRVPATARLPAPDERGLRTFKGRHYVDLPDGLVVQVATDAQTGLVRATLANERLPSGPELVRDAISGRWEVRSDLEPILFPLSEGRLEAFRTALDFTGVEPGGDGTFHHDNKLYVVIGEHAYQVLHDADSSSPSVPVLRIVRTEDPVAHDEGNRYVASRPGRSQAIVRDPRDGWVGVNVAGAGGMRRGEPQRTLSQRLADRFATLANRLHSPESRVRKLFPTFDEQQIAAFVRSLGDDVTGALTRREADYKTLKNALQDWTDTNAQSPAIKAWAQRVALEIKRCWRHETGAILKLTGASATLPALTADFSHVRTLELNGILWSGTGETFLNGFSGLQRLSITDCGLDKLPAAMTRMPDLQTLDLHANRLEFDEQSAAALGTMVTLEHIDLSANPLGRHPDFSGMSRLKTLNLRSTQLEQWPIGLTQHSGLERLDLRDNLLREVPDALVAPAADQFERIYRINAVTLIERNDFPAGYWKTLEAFWQRVAAAPSHPGIAPLPGAFRLDSDIPEVAMVQRLYPDKTPQEARAYLIALGDDADTLLAQRIEQLDLLESQLQGYVAAQETGTASGSTGETSARRVARIIKACWLDDSVQTLRITAGSGPLPALTLDFSHVKRLDLLSITWSDDADTFLGNFPNLEQLSINQCGLKTLPAVVGGMHSLRRLDLSANRIELDEPGAATLSALSRLTIIDLSHNPSLSLSPDFSAMAGLISVNMNNTGIRHWPTGLEDKSALTGLDLRNNRLREVPGHLLEPTLEKMPGIARINGATLLLGNDFPSDYWRHFDAYWRQLSDAYPELMDPLRPDAFDSENSLAQRYKKLFPAKSIKACREFLWNLEADSVNGRLEALEQEFGQLKSQLDDWVFSGGGNRQRYVRANQLQINAQTRNDRTAARDRIIACWRRETAQKHAVDGTPIGLELDLSGLILPTLPDLSIDFSHVGSLNLARMNLAESPEGFLTRFRHLRWLDMSNNRLRELPPAVGEMHAMTRLFLHGNQLQLTDETAAILAGRVTLRALWLNNNPQLGVLPDFSQITDMRSIDLSTTGISSWPRGLFDQPLLDSINLSHNRITTIPDFVTAPPADRLAQSVRANNSTRVTNNPLVDTTAAQLAGYVQRLRDAGLALNRGPNLVTSSQLVARQPDRNPLELREQWISGLSADEVAARRAQWRMLRELEGSDGFFNIIESRSGHADFRRQVWEVIDVMTDNDAQSRALRRELFDRACEAGCTDLAAATFTDLQILAVTHKARMQARQDKNGAPLVTLSRGLFRLKQVDDIAAAHVASSRLIINDPATSEAQRNVHRRRIRDQHEVTMAYRFGLKDRLQLPFQPQSLTFILMAEVTPGMLEAAYNKVIVLNDSPEEFQALVSMDFWQDFVIYKYQTQFEASRQPFQDRQAALDSQYAQEQLTEAQYIAQTNDGQAQLAIAEAALIQELTRQELQPRTTVETSPADESAAQTSA
ncbi:hypothetical protein HU765_16195 [Pseudomonas sp. SWRI81]|nr:hypothetical protein [Pseudomonas sp. SWRI81]